jgi:hypothetical protein
VIERNRIRQHGAAADAVVASQDHDARSQSVDGRILLKHGQSRQSRAGGEHEGFAVVFALHRKRDAHKRREDLSLVLIT